MSLDSGKGLFLALAFLAGSHSVHDPAKNKKKCAYQRIFESHIIIHTFKNYFATIFSTIRFQFSANKQYLYTLLKSSITTQNPFFFFSPNRFRLVISFHQFLTHTQQPSLSIHCRILLIWSLLSIVRRSLVVDLTCGGGCLNKRGQLEGIEMQYLHFLSPFLFIFFNFLTFTFFFFQFT